MVKENISNIWKEIDFDTFREELAKLEYEGIQNESNVYAIFVFMQAYIRTFNKSSIKQKTRKD